MPRTLIASPVLEGNHPTNVNKPDYDFRQQQSLASWIDDFFDDRDDVIAVFDFDYPQMTSYATKRGCVLELIIIAWIVICIGLLFAMLWTMPGDDPWGPQPDPALSITILATVIGIPLYVICVLPCITFQRNKWAAECHHLAITRDGILHVEDKHKQACGWPMCDKGRQSRTIFLDHVTDCTIKEPAGNFCCCVRNSLYEVTVHTTSSQHYGDLSLTSNSLVLTGLRDPYKFQEVIFAMKRSSRNDCSTVSKVESDLWHGHVESVEASASLIELV